MQSLATNPARHAFVRDERLAAKGYRILPVNNYLVFYTIYSRAKQVDVIRILYRRQNWMLFLD